MRKSEKKWKSVWASKQLNLFTRAHNAPQQQATGGTGEATAEVMDLLSRLTEQHALTEQLLEQIVDYKNLKGSYEQVRRNEGSAGIDGMTVKGLEAWLQEHLEAFRWEVINEQYEISPVKKVEIPKPNGGVRTLGIPTVKDRLLQQAIHQEMMGYYEPYFSENSYGFRPGRSAHDAVVQAAKYVSEGREWVVDIDLEKFFDRLSESRDAIRWDDGTTHGRDSTRWAAVTATVKHRAG